MTFADGTYIDWSDYFAISSLARLQCTKLQRSLGFPTELHIHQPQFHIPSNVATVSLVRTLPTLRPSFHSTRSFDYVAKSEHHDWRQKLHTHQPNARRTARPLFRPILEAFYFLLRVIGQICFS